MVTKGVGGGMNSEAVIDRDTLLILCVKSLINENCTAQGNLLDTLWPSKWEGNP